MVAEQHIGLHSQRDYEGCPLKLKNLMFYHDRCMLNANCKSVYGCSWKSRISHCNGSVTVWPQATVPTVRKWIANEQYDRCCASPFVDRNQLCTNALDVEKQRVFISSTWAAGCASQARPFSLECARLLTGGKDLEAEAVAGTLAPSQTGCLRRSSSCRQFQGNR
jgi:hypothetical protein